MIIILSYYHDLWRGISLCIFEHFYRTLGPFALKILQPFPITSCDRFSELLRTEKQNKFLRRFIPTTTSIKNLGKCSVKRRDFGFDHVRRGIQKFSIACRTTLESIQFSILNPVFPDLQHAHSCSFLE